MWWTSANTLLDDFSFAMSASRAAQRLDFSQEIGDAKGLLQRVSSTDLLGRQRRIRTSRHRKDRRIKAPGFQLPSKSPSVECGQLHIEHDEGGMTFLDQVERLRAISGFTHRVAAEQQGQNQNITER